jgi:transcriptional regulator with XRE-family HTH domain
MTSTDSSELKSLREKAAIELNDLAKITNLSVAQLKQLESGGDNLFYSSEIKAQAIKRVLKALDPNHPSLFEEVVKAAPTDQNPKNVIDEIVRLSSKGSSSRNVLPSATFTKKGPSAMAWGTVVVFLGVLILYWSPWDNTIPQLSSFSVTPPVNTSQTETLPVKALTNSEDLKVSSSAEADKNVNSPNNLHYVSQKPTDDASSSLSSAGDQISTLLKNSNSSRVANEAQNTSNPQYKVLEPLRNPNQNNDKSSMTEVNSTVGNAQTAPTPNTTISSIINDPCQFLKTDSPMAITPYPSKAGTYVYFTSTQKAQACVQDGGGKKTIVNLNKDQGTSVYGKGPWILASPDFSKFQIYFQGGRVLPPSNTATSMLLVEHDIQ